MSMTTARLSLATTGSDSNPSKGVPMDKRKFREVILYHGNPLAEFMGLTDWHINVQCESIASDHSMLCDTSALDYRMALITADPEKYDTEDEILRGIYHEYCHILHEGFSNYRLTSQALHEEITNQISRVEQRAWTHAAEGFVMRMEWIWRNHLRDLYLDHITRPV
jgi:hypothetical protein